MSFLVLGAGSIGRRHHDNLQALGHNSRLVGWRSFTERDLDDPALEGVVIATATTVRTDPVRLCSERNLPFYVEKPLAYRRADLDRLYDLAGPLAARCLAGFMMRYHPAFQQVAAMDVSQVYGFTLEIGHDVRQWRQNWRFAGSYAADPEGGGVLLDLCHELDMAACLVPDLAVADVRALGHADFPKVDFHSAVTLTSPRASGHVTMDYLSPVSLRRLSLRGLNGTVDVDFIGASITTDTGSGPVRETWSFERNEMFLAAMSDFVALVRGQVPSGIGHMPRLDHVRPACEIITDAWEARRFSGLIEGDYT